MSIYVVDKVRNAIFTRSIRKVYIVMGYSILKYAVFVSFINRYWLSHCKPVVVIYMLCHYGFLEGTQMHIDRTLISKVKSSAIIRQIILNLENGCIWHCPCSDIISYNRRCFRCAVLKRIIVLSHKTTVFGNKYCYTFLH